MNGISIRSFYSSGVKTKGEAQLAVRFTCSSLINTLHMYSRPLLQKMHYILPLSAKQLDSLRHQSLRIVLMKLSRAEPPLRKVVVEYIQDEDSHMWSMRRSKVNFFRIMSLLSGLTAGMKWFDRICNWKNPRTTILIHILFIFLVLYPGLILPIVFLYLFLIGLRNFWRRPRHPPHLDIRLSQADAAYPEEIYEELDRILYLCRMGLWNFPWKPSPPSIDARLSHTDELDEEFDTFPTSRPSDIVRMRYDRLRSIAGRIQVVAGDLATQGERFQSLVSWRDPRATTIFMTFCLITATVLYVVPFKVVALLIGIYVLRHPRYRYKLSSVPVYFSRRLSA